jgi:hypothetical protein
MYLYKDEKRDGQHCVRLLTRSAVKIQCENVAGGNDEEAAETRVAFDGAVRPN